MPTGLRFALKDMLHDRARTWLSIAGLAVVIASYFILSSLADAVANSMVTTTLSRNLIVIQNGIIDPSDSTIDPAAIQAAQALVPEMVSRVSPLVFRHTRIDGHVVQLRASAQGDWQPVHHLQLLEGNWPAQADEIIAGEGLALSNGWKVGTGVQIFGSEFRISGIFRSPGIAFASVWMPIDTFWALFDTRHNYQAMFVMAAAGVDPQVVLDHLLDDPRLAEKYAIYFEDNYSRHNIRALQDMGSLMTVVSWVALLGIVFGVYNATMLSTVERSREIGILCGIGFSHPTVQRFIWLRSLLQAWLAFLLGIILAFIFIASLQAFSPVTVLGVPFLMKLTLNMILAGFAWVAGLSMLGAWLATRRLFNQQVVELVIGA